MEVYKSEYLQILFFKENKLLEVNWLEETVNISKEDFKPEFLGISQAISKNRPAQMIVDESNLLFPIVPELQEWINKHVFANLMDGNPNQVAIILSHDLFVKVATEQLTEEIDSSIVELGYFETKEAAKEWIHSVSKNSVFS